MKPEYRDIIDRAVAVWNGADHSLLDRQTHRQFVYHHYAMKEPLRGVEALKGHIAEMRQAFPDLHIVVEEAFSEGEKFALKWTWSGIHKGKLRGIPASGKRVTQHGVDIVHMQGNLVMEQYCIADMLTLLRQIEAIPASMK
jgi:steroid delta-isomerase-like uncharacterized protein